MGLKKSLFLISAAVVGSSVIASKLGYITIGKLPSGKTLVSSGQIIERESFSFRGRPADIVAHPTQAVAAMTIMSQIDEDVPSQIVLATSKGIVPNSSVRMQHHPSFHGLAWRPDGRLLVASVGESYKDEPTDGLEVFSYFDGKLTRETYVALNGPGEPTRVVPGGLCFSRDGSRLYVACVDLNAVLELDARTFKRLRKVPIGMLPYTVKLSEDGTKLLATNWGGPVPSSKDRVSKTGISKVIVDKNGAAEVGTVSLINLATGAAKEIRVGNHPTDIAISGNSAYVVNSMSDSLSEVDLTGERVIRTMPLTWKGKLRMGAMPTAATVFGDKLQVCNGGDNAIAELDIKSGKVLGYRPTGFYPIGAALMDGELLVANSKGNGSLSNTSLGKPGNVHEFQGTISTVDLQSDLPGASAIVAQNNRWGAPDLASKLPVYNGAVKHVLYIIKENKTYDQIYGDMPQGNGDPKLCILGEEIMPNHRAIAREFTLFDNAYVSGTNSGDGHQWSTQALANDYVERFYVGYRTYNDDGNCAMSLSNHGTLWDAAAAKGLSVRDYGEFVVAEDAGFKPYPPKDWFEAWDDRKNSTHKFTFVPKARVAGLQPYVHPTVHYWPLIQSDQARADEFLKDLSQRIEAKTVPNLMLLSLPCDHTEGEDPNYPQPKSMMADNDLALGRIVDAISRSPIWKDTCIFVIEDDSQSGLDHVDGHRTPYMVISPYVKRGFVDHTFYTTNSMIRSMERMLRFGPMNRFDAMSDPIVNCFMDKPDFRPFDVRPNNVPLDLKNPGRKVASMTEEDRVALAETMSMDWSHPDGPDPHKLDKIIWRNVRPGQVFPKDAAARAERLLPDQD